MSDRMMRQIFSKKDYIDLCQEILYHDKLYYVEFNPVISDYEYDQLVFLLLSIEKKHPSWVVKWSPSQRIGDRTTGAFSIVKHEIPMISISNAYNKEELIQFINKIKKKFGEDILFDVELKIDGIAVSLIYENGIFCRAVSRGNGIEGEDITSNVKVIKSLPLYLEGSFPNLLEVRGEVFFTKQQFKNLNFFQEKQNKPLFNNSRNAAGGTLKLLNPSEVARRELSLIVYGVVRIDQEHETYSHYENLMLCSKLGFPIEKSLKREQCIEKILSIVDSIEKERPLLEYEIDGAVIKVDNIHIQNELGRTAKHTRWGIAYKFSPQKAITKILDIIVQIGRTGVLTPVAVLDPIFLSGSTISRVTLHNQEEIFRKGISLGDYVIVEKAGDVIPKVIEVDLSKRVSNEVVLWKMPKECPVCGSFLIKDVDKVALKCPNYKGCSAQIIGQLNFFVGKEGFNIDHMGEKVIEHLFYQGLVKKKSDIFFLDEIKLSSLPNFKEKSINNLLVAIEKAKKIELSRFITALGIPFVGKETANLLSFNLKNISNFLKISSMSKDCLLGIYGIGEKVADSIISFFSQKENIDDIHIMLTKGVVILEKEQKEMETSNKLENKTFVITGSLENFTRNEIIALIKKHGGRVSSSVSNKVDYLICGKFPGSKRDRAKSLNITLLSEKEFLKFLNN